MALDALMYSFHTSGLPFFHMSRVRAAVRKIVVVTNPHLFGVHTAVALETVWHQNSVSLLFCLAIALGVVSRR